MTVSAATDAAINHGNGFFDFKALRKFKKLQVRHQAESNALERCHGVPKKQNKKKTKR
jgi:hypothetical protein